MNQADTIARYRALPRCGGRPFAPGVATCDRTGVGLTAAEAAVLAACRALESRGEPLTVIAVAKAVAVPDRTLRRWLRKLVALGCIPGIAPSPRSPASKPRVRRPRVRRPASPPVDRLALLKSLWAARKGVGPSLFAPERNPSA